MVVSQPASMKETPPLVLQPLSLGAGGPSKGSRWEAVVGGEVELQTGALALLMSF